MHLHILMQPSKKVGNHIVSSLLLYDEATKNSAFIILRHLLFVIGISRFKLPEELQKRHSFGSSTSALSGARSTFMETKFLGPSLFAIGNSCIIICDYLHLYYDHRCAINSLSFCGITEFGDLTKTTRCRTEFTCLYWKQQTHNLRIPMIRYSTIHSHNSAVDEWQLCSGFFVFSSSFPKVSVFLLADNWQKRGFVNTNKTFFQKI